LIRFNFALTGKLRTGSHSAGFSVSQEDALSDFLQNISTAVSDGAATAPVAETKVNRSLL